MLTLLLRNLAMLLLGTALALSVLQRFDAPPPQPLIDASVSHADFQRCITFGSPSPLVSTRYGVPMKNRGVA